MRQWHGMNEAAAAEVVALRNGRVLPAAARTPLVAVSKDFLGMPLLLHAMLPPLLPAGSCSDAAPQPKDTLLSFCRLQAVAGVLLLSPRNPC